MELQGREAFKDYAQSIRASLANYRCDVLDCVSEADRAFVKMRLANIFM